VRLGVGAAGGKARPSVTGLRDQRIGVEWSDQSASTGAYEDERGRCIERNNRLLALRPADVEIQSVAKYRTKVIHNGSDRRLAAYEIFAYAKACDAPVQSLGPTRVWRS
jgi:hypothetical protein